MELWKIALFAMLAVFLYAIVRQLRAEFAPIVLIAAVVWVLAVSAGHLRGTIIELEVMASAAGIRTEYAVILLKILLLSLVTKLAADVCRDQAASSLASAVEISGKLTALLLSAPMMKSALYLALEWMNQE